MNEMWQGIRFAKRVSIIKRISFVESLEMSDVLDYSTFLEVFFCLPKPVRVSELVKFLIWFNSITAFLDTSLLFLYLFFSFFFPKE
jgi:hypothetical protein